MRVKWHYYGKMLLISLLLIGLFTLSIKPRTQDISAIAPASQITLQGQSRPEDMDNVANKEQEIEERTEPPKEQIELEKSPENEEPTKVDQVKESISPPTNPIVPQTTTAPTEELNPSNPPTEPPSADDSPDEPAIVEDSNHVEIIDNAEGGDAYFTTNLYNGQTLTEPSYYVMITQLDSSLSVEETVIELNKQIVTNFTGELTFEEGQNTVTIKITYADVDGIVKSAKQTYLITLNTKNIIIDTTASNQNVTDETYRFTAKAKLASLTLPLDVTLNKEPISSLAGYSYAVTLKPGENHLSFTATDGAVTEQAQFIIHYQEEQAYLTFETDLVDQKVSTSAFSFTANALYNSEAVPFTASLNGETLPANTFFQIELVNGTNTIQLQTIHQGEQLTKQFKILYSDPTITSSKPTDELAPKIKTDLTSGSHVKGLIKTINVWPTTAEGVRIRGKNVAVKVNGVGVPFVWDDAEKTSYKLNLQHGENQVEIRAWDNDGRVAKETFQVTAEDAANGVIGKATISVEASVLGIPYLIPPTKMDIHQGEKGSYILDQLLRQYGYSYNHTGTLDSNFYLSALKKPNMLSNVNIPDDLWSLVESSSTRAIRDDFNPHSLGEFDFANGSGWMFSINGDYPNYGFSDAYFLDGDVVRIRFTLHYGKDIRGFGSTGGGAGSNWDKDW